jgi:hypothetical protein
MAVSLRFFLIVDSQLYVGIAEQLKDHAFQLPRNRVCSYATKDTALLQGAHWLASQCRFSSVQRAA